MKHIRAILKILNYFLIPVKVSELLGDNNEK
jgi:hypothetical protein